jgi:hypothetical protein
MSVRRTSRRINSNCPSIDNIFAPNASHANIRSQIPSAILRLIETNSSISCSSIVNLPTFEPSDDFEGDIAKVRAAVF